MDLNFDIGLLFTSKVSKIQSKRIDEVQKNTSKDSLRKNVVSIIFDCSNEHPRLKLCDEYLRSANILASKARKR